MGFSLENTKFPATNTFAPFSFKIDAFLEFTPPSISIIAFD